MTVTKFKLPDLISVCPYKFLVNPHMDTVGEDSVQWVLDSGLLKHPRLVERFRNSRLDYCAAVCLPNVDAQRLRLYCDYLALGFAFDDVVDEGDGELRGNKEEAKLVMQAIANALLDPKSPPPDGFPAARLYNEWWNRVVKTCSPSRATQKRFVFETATCYGVNVEQVAGEAPDTIEEYIAFRRQVGVVEAFWGGTQILLGIDFPDHVFEDATLTRVKLYATDILLWINDLYSFNAEQAIGHSANMVVVAMKDLNLDVQGAVDYVGDRVTTAFKEYVELKATLPSWGPEIDEQVQKYFLSLEYCIVGTLYWYPSSPKYFGDEFDEVRRTLWVTLRPKELVAPIAAETA